LWNETVLKFCRWQELDPFQLTSASVADMLAWHEMSGKAHEVERLYNAMRVTYSLRDISFPDCPLAKQVVLGSRRIHAEEKCELVRHEFPVGEFKRLCSSSGPAYKNRATAVRDKAVIALGLRSMRRSIEIAQLQRGQVRWVQPSGATPTAPSHPPPPGMEGKYLEVYVRSQKNDQMAKGHWVLVEPTWSPSCMATTLYNYCEEFGISIGAKAKQDGTSHLPLFMSLVDKKRGISPGAINSLVKKAAKMLGLPPGVTSHSLRIGGCTAACGAGVPIEIVKAIGGWHSDAMVTYIRSRAAPAVGVSQRMGF
jgi:integrase